MKYEVIKLNEQNRLVKVPVGSAFIVSVEDNVKLMELEFFVAALQTAWNDHQLLVLDDDLKQSLYSYAENVTILHQPVRGKSV